MCINSTLRVLLVCLCSAALSTVSASPVSSVRRSTSYVSFPITRWKQHRDTTLDRRAFGAGLANQVTGYNIDVEVGTPPQPISVILDTGSSDIWFYAEGACTSCTEDYYYYDESTSVEAVNDLGAFQISYGSSDGVTGFYASDYLTISGNSVRQTIGVATAAAAGTPPGGIMGIGLPQGESAGNEDGTVAYPGYIDTLKSCGLIKTRAYSIYLNDQTPADETPGTIIFGGDNPSARTGDFVPFSMIDPAPDRYYRLDIYEPTIEVTLYGQSVAVPSSEITYTAHLDTGTTLTYIPLDQFVALIEILNGTGEVEAEQVSSGEYMAFLPCASAPSTGGMTFKFSGSAGSVAINVPWSELLTPWSDGYCMLGVASQDLHKAAGVYGFGDTFLRSAFVLYNFETGTISLAQASYAASSDEIVEI